MELIELRRRGMFGDVFHSLYLFTRQCTHIISPFVHDMQSLIQFMFYGLPFFLDNSQVFPFI